MIQSARRDDIQGLRAIAVLAVILFHFEVPPFTGGFIGVDVFFVISGYLITGKILNGAGGERFDYGQFVIGRMRRIFPAMLAVIALSFVAGAFLIAPLDFGPQSGSSIMASFGLSNFYFWYQSGYFDKDALLKPMLHTWSLAVEIQFYLVWPFFLLACRWLRRPRWIPWLIAGIAAVSFIASIEMMARDPSAAFYLLPFRIWEFAIGGLIVTLERRPGRSLVFNDIVYAAGLALIGYGLFGYGKATAFPGWPALAPAVGAGLVIFSGERSRLARFVSGRALVYLGDRSYSLYLVHWPLAVFAQYVLVHEFSAFEQACLFAATLASGAALHAMIERPFRRAPAPPRSPLFAPFSYLAIALAIALPAADSYYRGGWTWRLSEQMAAINTVDPDLNTYVWARQQKLQGLPFATEKTNLLVVGDSQSADFINALDASGHIDAFDVSTSTVFTECGLPSIDQAKADHYFRAENLLAMKQSNLVQQCKDQLWYFINSPLLPDADYVVIGMYWHPYALPYLQQAIDAIQQKTKAQIIILNRKNLARTGVDMVNQFGRLRGVDSYASNFRSAETATVNSAIAETSNATILDMMKITCPSATACNVLTDDNKVIFYGAEHFTRAGAEYMGRQIWEQLVSLLLPKPTLLPAQSS